MLSTVLNLLVGPRNFKVETCSAAMDLFATANRKSRTFKRSWYMIEASSINLSEPSVLSINDSVCLSVPVKGTVKRVLFLEKHALLKAESRTNRKNEHISIKLSPLTAGFAKNRLLKKLSQKYGPKFLLNNGSYPAKRLYHYYQALFISAADKSYESWVRDIEAYGWADRLNSWRTKISIVTPVFNTPTAFLKACVESVKVQTYTNWELILVDDGSDDLETISLLDELKKEEGIHILTNTTNAHISAASNVGIKAARGDYVVFLDHDDLLSPHALNELASAIDGNPSLKFIYSDEDFIDEYGQREKGHFKPDFNLDLLRSHNYITHIACFKREVLLDLNGFTEGLEGAQDFDLALRASEKLNISEIHHIPKVLYHWRKHDESTAQDASAKDYSIAAGLKALSAHYSRLGIAAKPEVASRSNYFRTYWPLDTALKVSIIIPTKDHVELLGACIKSIEATTDLEKLEFVIVDNGSSDQTAIDYLESLNNKDGFKVVRDDGDFNYSRLMNLGVANANHDYILMLNNDIEALESGWIEEMLSHASRADIGVVGSKLNYPDQTIQHAGVILGLGGYAAHSHRGLYKDGVGYFNRPQICQNISAVTGACMMVEKSTYDAVGGFDESFAVAYNDVDFCLRVLELGLKNLYTPYACLIHHESKTRGNDSRPEQVVRFNNEKRLLKERWQTYIDHDPAYNPNLTRSSECFGL